MEQCSTLSLYVENDIQEQPETLTQNDKVDGRMSAAIIPMKRSGEAKNAINGPISYFSLTER